MFSLKHTHRFAVLDSTQTYARSHLDSLSHGDVIVAEKQSAGIGQHGRRWHSPPGGNIYLTLVLEIDKKLPDIPGITLVAARVIVETMCELGVTGVVKPPNDVFAGGKKIAGIIGNFIPDSGSSGRGKLLLGVGINVNMSASELNTIDQPATSLSVLLAKETNPEIVLRSFLHFFGLRYSVF